MRAGGKRKLQPSHRTTAWMLWPFALWGIILIALYMAAYNSIANISSPLATLNIVNFVAIRFARTIFFAQVSGEFWLLATSTDRMQVIQWGCSIHADLHSFSW
jgi:hypothetical protein